MKYIVRIVLERILRNDVSSEYLKITVYCVHGPVQHLQIFPRQFF